MSMYVNTCEYVNMWKYMYMHVNRCKYMKNHLNICKYVSKCTYYT